MMQLVDVGDAETRESAWTPSRSGEEIPEAYSARLKKQGFELLEVIGRGRSGRVFKATQPSLARQVAVKFFDDPTSLRNAKLRSRFEREAGLLAKINSPAIPFVLTTGKIPGDQPTPYYVMEFVPGQPLVDVLAAGTLDVPVAVRYARHVLTALRAAHEVGVVHRDVAARNVLITPDERAVLIDFSLGVTFNAPRDERITAQKEGVGDADYAAPEQKLGGLQSGPASDLYSLGVLLFEMLVGHRNLKTLDRDLERFPQVIREAIQTACALQSDARPSASELLARLESLTPHQLRLRARPGPAFCDNLLCDRANWSPRGYYRGPLIVDDCTQNHCQDCGGPFIYECTACGSSFAHKPFCGVCGQQFFSVPTCESCGSWLTKEFITSSTEDGCSKCRARAAAAAAWEADYVPPGPGDDDIPF